MRIAVILGKMNGGGVEQLAVNYLSAMKKSELSLDIFCFENSAFIPKEEIERSGGKLFLLPSLKNPFKYIKVLTDYLKAGSYDIAHSHLSTLSLFPLLAAKKAGIAIRIVHSHSTAGGSRERLKSAVKKLLRPLARKYATDYFACSVLAAKWMYKGLPVTDLSDGDYSKKAVRIMPNAIDTERFRYSEEHRREIREETGIPDSAVVLGNIGRLCPQKNQEFLLKVFSEILKLNPNAYLFLVGTGPDRELLEKKAQSLSISERVVFCGQRSDAYKMYSAFDCFVLPSFYEGLPVVSVEAECCGLPCLFSDKVTREAAITENVRYMSLSDSPSQWAKAALSLSKNRDINGFETVKAKGFDICDAADKMEKYYKSRYLYGKNYLL